MFYINENLNLTDEKIDEIIFKCYESLKKLDFSAVNYNLGYGRKSFKGKEHSENYTKYNFEKENEITRGRSWINIEVNSYECIKFYYFAKSKRTILRNGVIKIYSDASQLEKLYEFWTNFLVAIRQYKLLHNKLKINTMIFKDVKNSSNNSLGNYCDFVREVFEELSKIGLNIISYKNGFGTDYLGIIVDEAGVEFYNFLKDTNVSSNINMHTISLIENIKGVFLNLDNGSGLHHDENYWTNKLLPLIKSYKLQKL